MEIYSELQIAFKLHIDLKMKAAYHTYMYKTS